MSSPERNVRTHCKKYGTKLFIENREQDFVIFKEGKKCGEDNEFVIKYKNIEL
jgi:hypothetical protein